MLKHLGKHFSTPFLRFNFTLSHQTPLLPPCHHSRLHTVPSERTPLVQGVVNQHAAISLYWSFLWLFSARGWVLQELQGISAPPWNASSSSSDLFCFSLFSPSSSELHFIPFLKYVFTEAPQTTKTLPHISNTKGNLCSEKKKKLVDASISANLFYRFPLPAVTLPDKVLSGTYGPTDNQQG